HAVDGLRRIALRQTGGDSDDPNQVLLIHFKSPLGSEIENSLVGTSSREARSLDRGFSPRQRRNPDYPQKSALFAVIRRI
ncbi:MAG TPA: hypothetical protein VH743_05270, partial [Beijerinckiaceae bacterium]